jgi:MerR family transcriptional regulator, light-induced transcriptional regulator
MTRICDLPDEPCFPIKIVSERTGIQPVTLRAWERRYQLLIPSRAENQYRLYSEQDVAILNWVKSRLDEGIQISAVARIVNGMRQSGDWPEVTDTGQGIVLKPTNEPAQKFVPLLFTAFIQKNEQKALALLREVQTKYPLSELFCAIISPVLVQIGEAWYEGRIGVSTEHFASSIIRGWLLEVFYSLPPSGSRKRILIGSGPEEDHEIGELMFACLLRERRYLVDYVGPDNPLEDLAQYTREQNAALVILTATLESNAKRLQKAQEMLNRGPRPVVFCFAGQAFNLFPALIPATPGVFLGRNLMDGIPIIQELLGKPG